MDAGGNEAGEGEEVKGLLISQSDWFSEKDGRDLKVKRGSYGYIYFGGGAYGFFGADSR